MTFQDIAKLDKVVNRDNIDKTMFTKWIRTNSLYEDARDLTYVDFPTKWVWQKDKIWQRRKK